MTGRKRKSSFSRDDSAPSNLQQKKFAGEDRPEMYETGGLKSTFHGVIYQLKLLMVFVCRGIKNRYEFALATEMVAAEKFDDVVFRYVDENTGNTYRFLQAKHKQDENKTITFNNLKTESDDDFSLQKYFISYLKIKQNPKFVGYKLKDFVICSNIDVDEDLRKRWLEPITCEDDILTFNLENKKICRRLKFKDSFPERDDIFSLLHNTSESFRLAKKLASCILENKKLELKGLFKSYHFVLGEQIIARKKKGGKEVGRFRTSFIDGSKLTPDITMFRNDFYKAYCSVSQQQKSKQEFFEKMKKVELNLSSTFGVKSDNPSLKTSLPAVDITDDKIKSFLNDLVLAVHQPNEIELDEIIKKEMIKGEHINLIDTECRTSQLLRDMLNWMKKKEGFFFRDREGKILFQKIEQNIYKLMVMGLTKEYCGRIEAFGINFEEINAELDNFMESPEKQIFNICCTHENILLSSIEVYQTLKNKEIYQKDDCYIFMRLSSILQKVMQTCVIEAFESTKTNYLIIECDTKENTNELFNNLKKIIGENTGKKIILIAEVNDGLAENFKKHFSKMNIYKENQGRKITINDFTQKSKEKILEEGMVIFQGEKMNLGRIMDKDIRSGALLMTINEELLTKFINKEDVYIGNSREDMNYGFFKDCYIERTLYQQADTLTQDIMKQELYYMNFYVIKPVVGKCRKPKLNDISKVDMKKYKPQNIMDITDRVVLITAEPGMGKSILLSHLAMNTKSILPPLWIVRCNSVDYLKYESNKKNETGSEEIEAVRFLYRIYNFQLFKKFDERPEGKFEKCNILKKLLTMDTNQEINFNLLAKHPNGKVQRKNGTVEECPNSSLLNIEGSSMLEMELFTHYYNQGRIVLLFDGFDEISPKYGDKAVKLLKTLQKCKIKKIWITTRPYVEIKQKIEIGLRLNSYSIESLDEKQQKEFLKKFWEKNLEGDKLNEDPFNTFVDKLFNKFSFYTSNQEAKFISIPLQLYMIAYIFKDDSKTINSSNGSDTIKIINKVLNDNWDLVSLYEDFIEKKITLAIDPNRHPVTYDSKIHGQIKTFYSSDNTDDDVSDDDNDDVDTKKNDLRKTHEILAVDLLLSETFPEKRAKAIKKLKKMIEQGIEKTGIILKIVDSKPEFVHRTFAEYFAANHLWENFKSIEISKFENFVQSHMIEKIIGNGELQLSMFFQLIVIKSLNDQTNGSDEMIKKWTILLAKLVDAMKQHGFKIQIEDDKPKFELIYWWEEGNTTTLCYQAAETLLKIFELSSLLKCNDNLISDTIIDSTDQYLLLCLCCNHGYIKIGNAIGKEIKIETLQHGIEHDDWRWSPLCLAAFKGYLNDMGILKTKYFDWVKNWKDVKGAYLIHTVMSAPKSYRYLLPLLDSDLKLFFKHYKDKGIQIKTYLCEYWRLYSYRKNYFIRIMNSKTSEELQTFADWLEADWPNEIERVCRTIKFNEYKELCNGMKYFETRNNNVIMKKLDFDKTQMFKDLITEVERIREKHDCKTYHCKTYKYGKAGFITHNYEYEEAFNEIERRISETENALNNMNLRLLTNNKRWDEAEKDLFDVKEMLEIGDRPSKHPGEIRIYVPDGTQFCMDILPIQKIIGQKKVDEIFREAMKHPDPIQKIVKSYGTLQRSFNILTHALQTQNYSQLDKILQENQKRQYIEAVIDGQDDELGSPLHYAAYKGDLEAAKILLKLGANPNLRLNAHAKHSLTPSNYGEFKMEVENKDWNYENWTSLHLAALTGNDQVVQILIEYGAKVNAPIHVGTTHKGNTALHLCALSHCGHSKSAQVLLENGAQYDAKNESGKTPIDLAKSDPEIKNLLDYINQLFKAVEDNETDAVYSLLEKIVEDKITAVSNTRNIEKKTLIQAAKANDQTAILELLENKLKPVERDYDPYETVEEKNESPSCYEVRIESRFGNSPSFKRCRHRDEVAADNFDGSLGSILAMYHQLERGEL